MSMTAAVQSRTASDNQERMRSMKELLQQTQATKTLPKEGDVVDGTVIDKARNRIYLDLGPVRTGVVYKGEIDLSLYDVNNLEVGDTLPAKIIELENEEGLVELSLKEAGLDRVWGELRETKNEGTVFPLKIDDANRGGLIGQLKGITGFLPVSQLAPEHYPHVEGGDKEEILKRLKEFVGTELEVKILDLDQKNEKLIFSERAKVSKEIEEKLSSYSVGQIIEGEVSGIVDFGAFVTFDGIEGLVHISELGWQLVENPEDIVSIGENVQAKIIAIEGDKVSLSIKALKPNPWDAVAEKYSKGDVIEGEVAKFNPFGAFVRVEPEIQGLAHVSEFGSYEKMTEVLEAGKRYTFEIIMLDPQDYKMALRLVDTSKPATAETDVSQAQPADKETSAEDADTPSDPPDENSADDRNDETTPGQMIEQEE